MQSCVEKQTNTSLTLQERHASVSCKTALAAVSRGMTSSTMGTKTFEQHTLFLLFVSTTLQRGILAQGVCLFVCLFAA